RRVPYSYLPPDELRKRIARTLYAETQRERPDWIDEQLLRPGQVAALFQVSRRTASDWARAGKLDAIITPAGHRRFRATHVREVVLADGFIWVFLSPRRAVACAMGIRRALDSFNLNRAGLPLRVRIGLNTGEVASQDGQLSGEAVHAAARVCAEAEGGQVLVS